MQQGEQIFDDLLVDDDPSMVELDENADAKIHASCDAGIKRFEHGKSNSHDVFKKYYKSSKKWDDPEFGADG